VLRIVGATSLALLALLHGIPDMETPEDIGDVAGETNHERT